MTKPTSTAPARLGEVTAAQARRLSRAELERLWAEASDRDRITYLEVVRRSDGAMMRTVLVISAVLLVAGWIVAPIVVR